MGNSPTKMPKATDTTPSKKPIATLSSPALGSAQEVNNLFKGGHISSTQRRTMLDNISFAKGQPVRGRKMM